MKTLNERATEILKALGCDQTAQKRRRYSAGNH